MKYSVDPSEIGCTPQIETMTDGYKYDAPDSIWKIDFTQKIAPNLNAFKLRKCAKKTDRLSGAVASFYAALISSAFVEILSDFSVASHALYEAQVIKMGRKAGDYYLLKFNESAAQYINTEESKFYLFNNLTDEKKPVELNEEQLIAALTDWWQSGVIAYPNSLRVERLVFKPEITELDLFSVNRLCSNPVISERLKAALEEAGITGVDYKLLPWVAVEEKA